MKLPFLIMTIPSAKEIEVYPFTGSPPGLYTAQEYFEYLIHQVQVSASPGFTWGRSGNCPASTWLLNDTVPSNKSGREVFLYDAMIVKIYVANQDATIRDIEIYSHDGDEVNLTLLGTVTTTAVRSEDFTVSYSIARGKQLATRIGVSSANSAKEPVVGILMTGTVSP